MVLLHLLTGGLIAAVPLARTHSNEGMSCPRLSENLRCRRVEAGQESPRWIAGAVCRQPGYARTVVVELSAGRRRPRRGQTSVTLLWP